MSYRSAWKKLQEIYDGRKELILKTQRGWQASRWLLLACFEICSTPANKWLLEIPRKWNISWIMWETNGIFEDTPKDCTWSDKTITRLPIRDSATYSRGTALPPLKCLRGNISKLLSGKKVMERNSIDDEGLENEIVGEMGRRKDTRRIWPRSREPLYIIVDTQRKCRGVFGVGSIHKFATKAKSLLLVRYYSRHIMGISSPIYCLFNLSFDKLKISLPVQVILLNGFYRARL